MTNTPRMTSKHMDTMDELRDAMAAFVARGKVVSIEEGRMLRLVQAASDEAAQLDLMRRKMALKATRSGRPAHRAVVVDLDGKRVA